MGERQVAPFFRFGPRIGTSESGNLGRFLPKFHYPLARKPHKQALLSVFGPPQGDARPSPAPTALRFGGNCPLPSSGICQGFLLVSHRALCRWPPRQSRTRPSAVVASHRTRKAPAWMRSGHTLVFRLSIRNSLASYEPDGQEIISKSMQEFKQLLALCTCKIGRLAVYPVTVDSLVEPRAGLPETLPCYCAKVDDFGEIAKFLLDIVNIFLHHTVTLCKQSLRFFNKPYIILTQPLPCCRACVGSLYCCLHILFVL